MIGKAFGLIKGKFPGLRMIAPYAIPILVAGFIATYAYGRHVGMEIAANRFAEAQLEILESEVDMARKQAIEDREVTEYALTHRFKLNQEKDDALQNFDNDMAPDCDVHPDWMQWLQTGNPTPASAQF